MPRAEIPEGVERFGFVHVSQQLGTGRLIVSPEGRLLHIRDLPAIKAHWLEQLKEELLSDSSVRAAAQGMFDALWSKPGNPTSVDRAEAEAALRAALASIPIEGGGDE
jgi:hypothetical protein